MHVIELLRGAVPFNRAHTEHQEREHLPFWLSSWSVCAFSPLKLPLKSLVQCGIKSMCNAFHILQKNIQFNKHLKALYVHKVLFFRLV